MSANSLSVPFPIFNDIDGDPLDAGYIYIGTANLDPAANPISVYFDEALTIPASQPIRTLNGFPSNSGAPARLYVASDDYSLTVKNKNSSLIYTALNTTEALGAGLINFTQNATGAKQRTVQNKLTDMKSVLDFDGVVGDGVNDDTAGIQAALDAMKGADGDGSGREFSGLFFPFVEGGFYKVTDTLVVDGMHGAVIQGAGGLTERGKSNCQLRWYGASSKPVIQIKGGAGIPSNPNTMIAVRDLTITGYQSQLTPASATPAAIALAGIYIGALDGDAQSTVNREILIENCIVYNSRFGIYSGSPTGNNTDHASITIASCYASTNLQAGVWMGTANTICYVSNCHIAQNGYAATDFAADNYSAQLGANILVNAGSTYITNLTSAGDDTYAPYSADIYQQSGQCSIVNAWSDTEGWFFYQASASQNDGAYHAGQVSGVRHYNGSASFLANTENSIRIIAPGMFISDCMVYGNIQVDSGLSGRPVFAGINFGNGPGGTGSTFTGSGVTTQRDLIVLGYTGNYAQIMMGGRDTNVDLGHYGTRTPFFLLNGAGKEGTGNTGMFAQWNSGNYSAGSVGSGGSWGPGSFADGSTEQLFNCYRTSSGLSVYKTGVAAGRFYLSPSAGFLVQVYDPNAGSDFTDSDWITAGRYLSPPSSFAGLREEMLFQATKRSSAPSFSSGDYWEGCVYYDTTTNKLRVNTGGSTWVDLH